MIEREVATLQAEVKSIQEDVVYLRMSVDKLHEKMDQRFITRMEVKAISSILGFIVTVLSVVEILRGRP